MDAIVKPARWITATSLVTGNRLIIPIDNILFLEETPSDSRTSHTRVYFSNENSVPIVESLAQLG